jgi:glycosyltransferase involved in cell wall biosynthesis
VIAGEGPYLPRLVARIPFAQRLGFLDRDTLAMLYASADVCVLPSFSETCGLVALEAMASGLPVIAADAGGLRESVRHGQNGLLAPPHDARAFAEAIIALVSNASRRRALGVVARGTALSRSVVTENAELLTQYAEVADLRPRELATWVA